MRRHKVFCMSHNVDCATRYIEYGLTEPYNLHRARAFRVFSECLRSLTKHQKEIIYGDISLTPPYKPLKREKGIFFFFSSSRHYYV